MFPITLFFFSFSSYHVEIVTFQITSFNALIIYRHGKKELSVRQLRLSSGSVVNIEVASLTKTHNDCN